MANMGEHKQKRPKLSAAEKLEAAGLEALIFSKDSQSVDVLGHETEVDLGLGVAGIVDIVERPSAGDTASQEAARLHSFEDRGPVRRRSAWEDPADQALQVDLSSGSRLQKLRQAENDGLTVAGQDYQRRLRVQHSKLNPRTGWAAINRSSEDQDAAEEQEGSARIATRAGGLLAASRALPPGQLETTRLKDANHQEPSQSVVSSVAFHPNGQLLLAAGLDRHLRFFNVDGVSNPHVQSVFLEDMPVHSSAYVAGGAQVVAAGRRRFFYVLDLDSAKVERVTGIFGREERSLEAIVASTASSVVAFLGRDGHVPLVSLASRQAVGGVKMNGTARAGSFSADGTQLMTTGGDGTVYVWDLRTQRCLSCYVDDGSVGGAAVACSPDASTFACGSSSGVVNVYQHPRQSSAAAEAGLPEARLLLPPLRSLPHLTTTVDSLAFNHDGQVLAMASRLKRDSLRLVHLPTLKAFANWPTARTPLHYVHSLAFSPGGGYLAVGNAKGRVLLYRMHHYPQA